MKEPEEIIINGKTFIKRTPSDGYEFVKVGTDEHYSEAIDLPNSKNEYIEVELPPQEEDEEVQIEEVVD